MIDVIFLKCIHIVYDINAFFEYIIIKLNEIALFFVNLTLSLITLYDYVICYDNTVQKQIKTLLTRNKQ